VGRCRTSTLRVRCRVAQHSRSRRYESARPMASAANRAHMSRLVSNLRGALAFRSKRRSSRWALPVPAVFLSPSVAPAAGGHLFVRAPMSRVPWHLLQERQQRAHLVVAVLRADQLGGEPNPRAAQIVLARREDSETVQLLRNDRGQGSRPAASASRVRGQGRCPKVCRCCGGSTYKHPPRVGNRMDTSVGQRNGAGIGSYAAQAK
jgi:hypothetical protein